MTITVKNATANDIPAVLFLGKKMHLESRYKKYNFDSGKCIQSLMKLMDSPSGIVILAVCHDEIVGVFVGYVSEHFFGKSLASGDLIFYVSPEHRSSKAGKLLLREYINRARSMDVDDIRVGNSTGIMTKRVVMFYESNGFKNVGNNFTLSG